MPNKVDISQHIQALSIKMGLNEVVGRTRTKMFEQFRIEAQNVWPANEQPPEQTVGRWFNGTAGPTNQNLPRVARTLDRIAGDEVTISQEMLLGSPEAFAKSIGVDYASVQAAAKPPTKKPAPKAKTEKAAQALTEVEEDALRRHGGLHYSYRIHRLSATPTNGEQSLFNGEQRPASIRRSVVVIRRNPDGPGLQFVLASPGGKVWKGPLELSGVMLSTHLHRQAESGGQRGSYINLFYNSDSRLEPQRFLYGLRSRLSDIPRLMLGAYRVLLIRAENIQFDADKATDRALKELSQYADDFPVVDERDKKIAGLLRGEIPSNRQDKSDDPSVLLFYLSDDDIKDVDIAEIVRPDPDDDSEMTYTD